LPPMAERVRPDFGKFSFELEYDGRDPRLRLALDLQRFEGSEVTAAERVERRGQPGKGRVLIRSPTRQIGEEDLDLAGPLVCGGPLLRPVIMPRAATYGLSAFLRPADEGAGMSSSDLVARPDVRMHGVHIAPPVAQRDRLGTQGAIRRGEADGVLVEVVDC